jgi:hypothetical protein
VSEQPHEGSGSDARARGMAHLRPDIPLRPWREEARARAMEIQALSAWVDQLPPDERGEPRAEADRRLAESIRKHVQEVQIAARGEEARMRTAARLARATSHVHAAEADLLRRAPRTYVKGELPNLEAHVRRHLPADDPRRVRVEDLARPDNLKNPGWNLSETERESLIAAVRAASSAAAREQQRVRSFSRIIWAASGLMFAIAVLVAIVGFRAPEFLALCFQPQQDEVLVCPTRESPLPVDGNGNDLRDVDEVVAETVRPSDVPLVEFIGMVAAGVTGAVALRRLRGSSTPFAIPVALNVLKLPTGALTAFLGLLLMRGGFVPGLTALDSAPQIIAWAVLFGASQQLFTGLVDRQAQSVLDSIGGKTYTATGGS